MTGKQIGKLRNKIAGLLAFTNAKFMYCDGAPVREYLLRMSADPECVSVNWWLDEWSRAHETQRCIIMDCNLESHQSHDLETLSTISQCIVGPKPDKAPLHGKALLKYIEDKSTGRQQKSQL